MLTEQQKAAVAYVMDYLTDREDADDGTPNEEMRMLMDLIEAFGDLR